MRFFRILPEVCANTTWSLSSFTLNIALGKSSATVPANSIKSSFGIPYPSPRNRKSAPTSFPAPSRSSPLSSADMQHAEQREQLPRGGEIDGYLAGQGFAQQLGALVVYRATAHIDRFELGRRGGLDRVIIALAQHEVVLDQAAKRRKRQRHLLQRLIAAIADVEHQPVLGDRQMEMERPRDARGWDETVLLEKIGYGDGAIVLDIGVAADDGAFVERDLGDALRGLDHGPGLGIAPRVEPNGYRLRMRVQTLGLGQGHRRRAD